MEAYVVMEANYLEEVYLYNDLQTLIADFDLKISKNGLTEEELIKEIYNTYELIITKKQILSMKDVFSIEYPANRKIIKML